MEPKFVNIENDLKSSGGFLQNNVDRDILNKALTLLSSEKITKHYNHWVIGHMAEGIFHTGEFEVKWHKIIEGEGSPPKLESDLKRSIQTITILVKGKHEVFFPDYDNLPILKKPFDSVYWKRDLRHGYIAHEKSTVLTIRWPSEPKEILDEGDKKFIGDFIDLLDGNNNS